MPRVEDESIVVNSDDVCEALVFGVEDEVVDSENVCEVATVATVVLSGD